MMTITKSTPIGNEYAIRRYNTNIKSKFNFAYAVWVDKIWHGVILFGYPTVSECQFDKWRGQVQEMYIALESGTDIETAIKLAFDALRHEAPCVDLVITHDDRASNTMTFAGTYGNGKKGAYVINGEKIHKKMVKENGWRPSVLWLREHVDAYATQFDVDAENLYVVGMTDHMKERLKILEVR